MQTQISARWTLWVNRCLGALVLAILPLLPAILDFYTRLRPLASSARRAILIGYCCCVPVILYASRCIELLLKNILSRQVFVTGNIRCIRHVRWCCAAVSIICLPASWFYPPLFFLVLIMAFLTLMVTVVMHVMAAAVEIREENDLTV